MRVMIVELGMLMPNKNITPVVLVATLVPICMGLSQATSSEA
jgi:hypothetical protein